MSEEPGKEKAGDPPAGGQTQTEPANSLTKFGGFLKSWPVLGGAFLVLGGGVWNYIQPTSAAPYILALGICLLVFVSFHNLFSKSGKLVCFGIPGIASAFIMVGTHLMVVKMRPSNALVNWGPIISPSRIQLSDGTNLLGTKATIFNPSPSNVYALTFGFDIENAMVPIASVVLDLSKESHSSGTEYGEPVVGFDFVAFDLTGYHIESRLFGLRQLKGNEVREVWIRGTVVANSFMNLSVLQYSNAPFVVKYDTNGGWRWPLLSSNSPFWKRMHAEPFNLSIGMQMNYGSNRIKIPSRPL